MANPFLKKASVNANALVKRIHFGIKIYDSVQEKIDKESFCRLVDKIANLNKNVNLTDEEKKRAELNYLYNMTFYKKLDKKKDKLKKQIEKAVKDFDMKPFVHSADSSNNEKDLTTSTTMTGIYIMILGEHNQVYVGKGVISKRIVEHWGEDLLSQQVFCKEEFTSLTKKTMSQEDIIKLLNCNDAYHYRKLSIDFFKPCDTTEIYYVPIEDNRKMAEIEGILINKYFDNDFLCNKVDELVKVRKGLDKAILYRNFENVIKAVNKEMKVEKEETEKLVSELVYMRKSGQFKKVVLPKEKKSSTKAKVDKTTKVDKSVNVFGVKLNEMLDEQREFIKDISTLNELGYKSIQDISEIPEKTTGVFVLVIDTQMGIYLKSAGDLRVGIRNKIKEKDSKFKLVSRIYYKASENTTDASIMRKQTISKLHNKNIIKTR